MLRGAVFPYILSPLLYQGSMLMDVLNWTGLIVNGGVAFVFPLVVCGVFFARQATLRTAPLSPTHLRTVLSPKSSRAVRQDEKDCEMSVSGAAAAATQSSVGMSDVA
jgi:hypothetical protein